MNVIAETTDDAYLTAHGSNAAMKQCARRFRQSQFPDLGKQLAIKVFPSIWKINFILPTSLQDLSIDPMWFEIRPGSNETFLLEVKKQR